jgi:glutamate-1-semialdehyde aminotransferase/acyl carrier protein
MPNTTPAMSLATTHYDLIISTLREMLKHLIGEDLIEIDVHKPLIELGADSLFLLQASQKIRDKFNVRVPFRLLLEELSTLDAIAVYLDQRLPNDFSVIPGPVITQSQDGVPEAMPEEPRASKVRSETDKEQLAPRTVSSEPISYLLTPETPYYQSEKVHPNVNFAEMRMTNAGGSETNHGAIQQIITQQLQISEQQLRVMSMQLDLLRDVDFIREDINRSEPLRSDNGHRLLPPSITYNQAPQGQAAVIAREVISEPIAASASTTFEPEGFVAYEPIERRSGEVLTDRQRNHLNALIARVVRRTQSSKRIAQSARRCLANNRATACFRVLWKEMVYPLMLDRAKDSRVWDVDGNEYIDLTMGFGALLFGHTPDFILNTLQEQIKRGLRLGGHTAMAGEVAKLICELTGVERVAFCNSGTEAVMSALRLARAVRGRSKIALFEGCYHGTFDGVMVRGGIARDGHLRAIPLAPGVPEKMVEDAILLKYDSPESIEIIRAHAHELAAILIEPPRSRRPDVQPAQFLRQLRQVADEAGLALIFDEVVTGFRFHTGGAQALFGVQADLVTYGKAMGGGLPVAAIAGKAAYMDAIDGGMWNYGDGSLPEADITFFAGTYFQHPLIMPALWAVLNHIKENGTQLQEQLAEKTTFIAESLNSYFDANNLPLRVAHWGSLFRLLHPADLKYMDLFYYYLLERGIFVGETRNCMLSTAHTNEDIQHILQMFKESIEEMRAAEFLPVLSPKPPPGQQRPNEFPSDSSSSDSHLHTNSSTQSVRVPLTESQKQIWALAMMGDEGARACNQSNAIDLRGPLNVPAMEAALRAIVNRHEALRAGFTLDGDYQEITSTMNLEIPLTDLSHLVADEREAQTQDWLLRESQQIFDLTSPPLVSARILKLDQEHHVIALTMHHIITDGWSTGIILNELKQLYQAGVTGVSCDLPVPYRFSEYAMQQAERQRSPEMQVAEDYWLNLFAEPAPPLELPAHYPRPVVRTLAGAQCRMLVEPSLHPILKKLSARQGCTLFMILLGAFKVLLYHLTGKNDVVVGTPAAGQILSDDQYLVGYCVNLLPLRSIVIGTQTFTEFLWALKQALAEAYEHQDYPYRRLLKKLNLPRDASRPQLVSAIFNLDRSLPPQDWCELKLDITPNHNGSSKFDMTLDVTETETGLVLDCRYDINLFSRQQVLTWLQCYEMILKTVAQQPNVVIDRVRETLRDVENQYLLAQGQALKQIQRCKLNTAKRQAVCAQAGG